MKKALWIARRELGSFFYSPIFYVVTTVFLFIYSYMFFSILNFFSFQSFQSQQFAQMGLTLNVNEMVIEPSISNMAVVLLFIIPLITMRSFAEEKKAKSFPLLLSSPVHLREIIAGKFLACLGVVAIMLLLSSYSMVMVAWLGEPEFGPILSGYLGILLMAGCYISLGIFASSLTDNQIISAVISFGFILFMWIIGWAAQATSSGLGEVLQYIALVGHMESFLKGILDSSDLIYYLTFIAFGLFLTYRVVDSRRWS